MKRIVLSISMAMATMFAMAIPTVSPLYVAPGGQGDGSSWASPLGSIAEALNIANNTPGVERPDVWVKGGTYLINSLEDRLLMRDSVSVYASFAGTETSVDERKKVEGGRPWEFENQTIVDGQSQWPLLLAVNQQDTSNHEFFRYVDGIKFMNGRGVADSTKADYKAPIYVRYGTIFRYCQVVGNESYYAGAGFAGWPAYDVLYCLVKDNRQYDDAGGGGGIYINTSSFGMPAYVTGCDIEGNFSNIRGGGMTVQGESLIHIRDCRIFNNSVSKKEDGEYKGGGSIYNQNGPNTIIVNNLIYNNTGNMYVNPRICANNTIVKNIGAVYVAGATSDTYIANNIIWGLATDETGSRPTSIGGVAAELKAWNNISYHGFPVDKSWRNMNNVQFSSNVNNGKVTEPPFGCGSGPYFNKFTSFIGAIPDSLAADEKAIFLAELYDPDLFRLRIESPCFNSGIEPIDTVMIITRKIVGGRPKSDTTYQYNKYVLDDFLGVTRPQGATYDMGAFELPFFGVLLAYDENQGLMMSETGEVLANGSSLATTEGQSIMVYVINQSASDMKVVMVESEDGGKTYTGAETDLTSQVDESGLLTLTPTASCQLKLVFDSPQGLKEVEADSHAEKMVINGRIVIIKNGERYSILGEKE